MCRKRPDGSVTIIHLSRRILSGGVEGKGGGPTSLLCIPGLSAPGGLQSAKAVRAGTSKRDPLQHTRQQTHAGDPPVKQG